MFSPDDSGEEKLKVIQEDFEACVEHDDERIAEAHRASRFYHNTHCEGQWEEDDIDALRDEGRPVFACNLVRGKIDTFVGMMLDEKRTPIVNPAGAEDKLLAEALSNVAAAGPG